MRSYFMQGVEGRATLESRETDIPEPSAGQILVKMRAASLNRGEFIVGHGLLKPGGKAIIMLYARESLGYAASHVLGRARRV